MSDLVERLREFGDSGRAEGGAYTMSRAFMDRAADEIERLRAENEALRKDAERYRAIRNAFLTDDHGFADRVGETPDDATADDFDASIDAALAGGGK